MDNHRLDLEYLGTAYRGWQAQKNARGVANVVEAACKGVFKDVRQLTAAGRTDAGVHALHQVVHVRSAGPKSPHKNLLLSLNDALPADVAVTRASKADEGFDARRDAVGRVYKYRILRRRSAFGADQAWWVKDPLDASAMRAAAALLTGRHDFAAFSDLDPEKPRVTALDLDSIEIVERGALLLLRFRARFFLWKMARRLTGYLVEVGRGCFKAGLTPALFAQDRKVLAPYTAPPQGLFLEKVLYAGDAFTAPLNEGVLTR
jgi:tRNA pseudouridine38-40 synthase